MSADDTAVAERLHAMAAAIEMPPAPPADDVGRGRRRVRRNRAVVAGAAAACVAVVLGVVAAVGGPDRADSVPDPVEPPGIVVGSEPVWFDERGLHRGDVVEQIPATPQSGTLAVVRSGALYAEQGSGDVWFHPWGGEPRIVGHNSVAGPGGDPNGDTAAWFDHDVLVVYDTAAGRVLSSTVQEHGVSACPEFCAENYPPGNGFLQVSAEQVVWRLTQSSAEVIFSLDVRTGATSEIEAPDDRGLVDVHDQIQILQVVRKLDVVVRVPGQADRRYPELYGRAKVSPTGNYLLTVEESKERFGAAIVDHRTGEVWRVPPGTYPWIAWSSGDIAMVDVETALLACDPARRSCEQVPTDGSFMVPTN